MNFQIVSLLCLGLAVGVCCSKITKIVGGDDADIKDFIYQASLRRESLNWHFCGGSIISEFHILTAAHCIIDKMDILNDIRVYTGTSTSKSRSGWAHKIKKHYIYKDYVMPKAVDELQRNDIAIIMIEGAILFNRFQGKINLPTKDVKISDTVVGSGWGVTSFPSNKSSEQLQKIWMKIIDKSNCANILQRVIHDEHFCALDKQGSGMCLGDSGGPLVSDGKIVGFMTYIIPCGRGYPDIFISIYHYLDFIKSIINNHE